MLEFTLALEFTFSSQQEAQKGKFIAIPECRLCGLMVQYVYLN